MSGKRNMSVCRGHELANALYIRPDWALGVCGKDHLCVSILRGSTCAEGMGCGRIWVRWVHRGTGTANGHPGVP